MRRIPMRKIVAIVIATVVVGVHASLPACSNTCSERDRGTGITVYLRDAATHALICDAKITAIGRDGARTEELSRGLANGAPPTCAYSGLGGVPGVFDLRIEHPSYNTETVEGVSKLSDTNCQDPIHPPINVEMHRR